MRRKMYFLITGGISIIILIGGMYLYAEEKGDVANVNRGVEEKIKERVRYWEDIDNLNLSQLKKRYKELIKISKPYVIRKYLEKLMIPSGEPPIYGKELNIKFDRQQANKMIRILRRYEKQDLNDEQRQRYIRIAKQTACRYCCGAKALIKDDGSRACGCAHSSAMRGLIKYLIAKHGEEYSDEKILREANKWRRFFFPKYVIAEVLKPLVDKGELDDKVLEDMPIMVGGC